MSARRVPEIRPPFLIHCALEFLLFELTNYENVILSLSIKIKQQIKCGTEGVLQVGNAVKVKVKVFR